MLLQPLPYRRKSIGNHPGYKSSQQLRGVISRRFLSLLEPLVVQCSALSMDNIFVTKADGYTALNAHGRRNTDRSSIVSYAHKTYPSWDPNTLAVPGVRCEQIKAWLPLGVTRWDIVIGRFPWQNCDRSREAHHCSDVCGRRETSFPSCQTSLVFKAKAL